MSGVYFVQQLPVFCLFYFFVHFAYTYSNGDRQSHSKALGLNVLIVWKVTQILKSKVLLMIYNVKQKNITMLIFCIVH